MELAKQDQRNTKRQQQRKNHGSHNVILRTLLHADARDHKRIPTALKRFVSNLPLKENYYDDITGPDSEIYKICLSCEKMKHSTNHFNGGHHRNYLCDLETV